LLRIPAARRARSEPDHSDLYMRSNRERQPQANDDLVCVAALLKYLKAAICFVGGERFRETRLVARQRQLGKEDQVSTVDHGTLDELQMFGGVRADVTGDGSKLNATNLHCEIVRESLANVAASVAAAQHLIDCRRLQAVVRRPW